MSRSNLRRRAAPICALALLALLATACSRDTSSAVPARRADGLRLSEAAAKFLTIEAAGEAEGETSGSVPGRLALRPDAVASIGAPVAGRVVTVRVRPGERVHAGTPLLVLQSPEAAAARSGLEQAAAKAAAAEQNLRRHQEMMAKGVGVESERFEAEIRAREARAELDRARRTNALAGEGGGDRVTVLAPAAAVVMSIKAAAGAMVTPGGESLLELADPSRLWVVADVPETEAARIAAGDAVTVSVPAADRQIEGTVNGTGARVDADTRRVPVYISLKRRTAGLAPGMLAEVRFARKHQSRLALPVTAVLIKSGGRRIVYVQGPDGGFEPREVRTGPTQGGRVVILDGLRAGERVVVKGALLLDGEAEQLL